MFEFCSYQNRNYKISRESNFSKPVQMKMETFDKIGKKLDFVKNIGIFHTVMLVPACGNTV